MIKIIYNSFCYNNKTLHELKGVVIEQQNTEQPFIAGYDHITFKLNNYANTTEFLRKSRQPISFRRQIFFESITEQEKDEIVAWLDTPLECWYYDCNSDGTSSYKQIKAIVDSSSFDVQVYYSHTESNMDFYSVIIDLKFIAYNGYWYSINKDDVLTFNNPGTTTITFTNDGTTESQPYIRFLFTNGTQTIKFLINDDLVTVKNCNNYLDINSETEVVKDSSTDRFGDMEGKFPVLKVGSNKIQILEPSTIQSLYIQTNSRWK